MATSVYKRCYVSWDSVPVMLSLSEASVLLRMPEDTVRKHLESGALPGIKIGRQCTSLKHTTKSRIRFEVLRCICEPRFTMPYLN